MIPLLSEGLVHSRTIAHDVICALDDQAGIDLDHQRSGHSVLVNHGDTTLTGAAFKDGLGHGLGNGIGILSRAALDAYDVVVLSDVDGRVDAETNRGLCRIIFIARDCRRESDMLSFCPGEELLNLVARHAISEHCSEVFCRPPGRGVGRGWCLAAVVVLGNVGLGLLRGSVGSRHDVQCRKRCNI